MPVFDTDRNVTIDDKTVVAFAKAQIDGDETGLTQEDWLVAIQERADRLYGDLPLTKEQRFARSIHGVDPEHGKGNPIGDLLYKAYKAAPRATPPQSPAPVDLAAAVAKRAGSASEKMLALAREHQRIFPNKSDAAAYTAVYMDPRNVALKQKVVEEHWSLVGVGDTAYQDSHSGAYSNPHPGGSGPRPST